MFNINAAYLFLRELKNLSVLTQVLVYLFT